MKRNFFVGISLVLLVFGLVFTGCPQPESLSSDATMKSITVAGVSPLSLGEPSTSWLTVVPGDVYLSASQLVDARVSVSTSADGAEVFYSVIDPGAEPWFDKNSVVTLQHENLLWVEIFSPNLDAFLVYAFRIHNRTPRLTSVNVSRSFTTAAGGMAGNQGFTSVREAVSLGTPANSWNAVSDAGELWVGKLEFEGYDFTQAPNPNTQSQDIKFVAVPEMSDSVLTYAVASGTSEPVFVAEMPAITSASNGDWLYIKSVSADDEYGETVFYKIKLVEKNDDYSLSGITFSGVAGLTIDHTMLVRGYHSLVGQEAWGSYFNGANLSVTVSTTNTASDITITATPTAATTTVGYGIASGNIDYLIGQFDPSGELGTWTGTKIIAIEITNELGETAYHRFNLSRTTN